MSDQVVANHTLGLLGDLLRSVEDMHATFHAASENTFTTAASLHLSFDDEALGVVELPGHGEGLSG